MEGGKDNLKEIYLATTTQQDLDVAYRSLSIGGRIVVRINRGGLWEVLRDMEGIGFVAMDILNQRPDKIDLQIVGYKGKHGPCLDTGRTATYTGSAVAVMDDDNHLLFRDKSLPVCEKTSKVYGFSSYEGLIVTTSGSEELKEKLRTDPKIFDCNTLEDDLSFLYKKLKDVRIEEVRVNAFYPGPFKILILSDGTIVRRGKVNSIPEVQQYQLAGSDRIQQATSEVENCAVYFQEQYPQHGSLCLTDEESFRRGQIKSVDYATDLNALTGIHRKIRHRLTDLVESNRKYFILTGSDPSDDLGCCPSNEVGEANRLVRSGILSSVAQEGHNDACPVTIYAFQGEIVQNENDLHFELNEELRRLVMPRLKINRLAIVKGIIKWSLIAFLLISTMMAVFKVGDMLYKGEPTSLYQELGPITGNTTMILLFHNQMRCTMCLNMEAHIRDLLQNEYPQQVSDGRIQFSLINMNQSDYQEYVTKFELYTASVVLIQFKDKQASEIIVLRDLWKYHSEKDEFVSIVNTELEKLIEE